MRCLPRTWFARDAPEVAPELLNKLLVSDVGGERVIGRIVEVEAYTEDDPASHTYPGPTSRNATMFGPPGHLYVYLSYGIHRCANVVTADAGRGHAVLLRAVVPVAGIATMRRRRGERPDRELVDGPGKVGSAFGFELDHDGTDVIDPASPVHVADDGMAPPLRPLVGPRIGLTKAVDTPWRFRVPHAER